MEAGKMRHRISIIDRRTGKTILTARASKEPLLGNEYYKAEQAQSKVEVKFRMRYRAGVENNMRVQHGSDLYDILSAIDVESRGSELLIYAKRVNA